MRIMPQIVNLGLYDAALVHKNMFSTKLRKVSLYEIELAVEDGGCSYIGSRKFQISKGCVICAKPGQVRHTDLPYKCYYIHVIIEDEALLSTLNTLPDFYTPSDPAKLEKAFRDLIAEHTFPDRNLGISVEIKLLEILSMLIKDARMNPQNAAQQHRNAEFLRQALDFIDKNYTRSITLDDIAAHVHLSKIYFHNLFAAATGQTPHNYLLSKRISAVKFLLTTTDRPLSEIALESGFSSQSYMAYVFKRETSYTPMQFKKRISLLWDKA